MYSKLNLSRTNLGILFLIIFLFTISLPLTAGITFPKLTGRVVDTANIISIQVENQLSKELALHEKQTNNQVVVVTLSSLQGNVIEDYGYQLGRHWGIGQKDKNNGVLLIIAPNERKVRIEVGYGLEGILTDAISHNIIQNRILPDFRNQNYERGITAGVRAVFDVLDGSYKETATKTSHRKKTKTKEKLYNAALAIFIIFFLVGEFLAVFMMGRLKTGLIIAAMAFLVAWLYTQKIFIGLGVALFNFIFHLLNGARGGTGGRGGYSGGSGYSSGGFSGGGFSSGGFSGGGGSFGGGGASGGW